MMLIITGIRVLKSELGKTWYIHPTVREYIGDLAFAPVCYNDQEPCEIEYYVSLDDVGEPDDKSIEEIPLYRELVLVAGKCALSVEGS